MKKLFASGLLACAFLINSSFTTFSGNLRETKVQRSENCKLFIIKTHSTVPIGNTGCTLTVTQVVYVVVDFHHPPTIIGYEQPVFSTACRSADITGSISKLELDADGHCTDIEYAATGDSDIDAALSDKNNLDLIMADFDQEMDAQKN